VDFFDDSIVLLFMVDSNGVCIYVCVCVCVFFFYNISLGKIKPPILVSNCVGSS